MSDVPLPQPWTRRPEDMIAEALEILNKRSPEATHHKVSEQSAPIPNRANTYAIACAMQHALDELMTKHDFSLDHPVEIKIQYDTAYLAYRAYAYGWVESDLS